MDSEIKDYINDVLTYGCQSGIVTSLITYNDTKNFTKNYLDEMEYERNKTKKSLETAGEAVLEWC